MSRVTTTGAAGGARRARARQATLAEIHATARELLVTHGSEGVTINAVAREMGMSGPALYHYFASHGELVDAVTAGFLEELVETMVRARDGAEGRSIGRRLAATAWAMRSWAVDHPAEFGWIFARPLGDGHDRPESARQRAGRRFERIFADLFIEQWQAAPFPVPDVAELPEGLLAQLREYGAQLENRLPPEAVQVFLSCWARLYGLLCMEVLHQLDFALSDPEPMYELCLEELFVRLGLEPGDARRTR